MKPIYLLFLCLGLFEANLFGHEQIVHELITINAAETALDYSPAYADFMNAITSDVALKDATNSMRIGSFDEDFGPKEDSIGGYRSLNHFYDPLDTNYGKGLSDSPPDRRIVVGTNSFAWGSVSNCIGYNFPGVTWFDFGKNENTSNIWSWPNARGCEWVGLTAPNKADRQAALANMFRAVGQLMHLLQDDSQPQHVRNEQHLDQFVKRVNTTWRSPIEDYGRANVTNLNYQHGMLDWRADGFTKLEDFWDRHLYNGNSAALDNAETNGGTQLGLAEWCNGNFLGARHTYAEFFDNTSIEHYPFPSLADTTQPKLALTHFSEVVIDSVILPNQKQGIS